MAKKGSSTKARAKSASRGGAKRKATTRSKTRNTG